MVTGYEGAALCAVDVSVGIEVAVEDWPLYGCHVRWSSGYAGCSHAELVLWADALEEEEKPFFAGPCRRDVERMWRTDVVSDGGPCVVVGDLGVPRDCCGVA